MQRKNATFRARSGRKGSPSFGEPAAGEKFWAIWGPFEAHSMVLRAGCQELSWECCFALAARTENRPDTAGLAESQTRDFLPPAGKPAGRTLIGLGCDAVFH